MNGACGVPFLKLLKESGMAKHGPGGPAPGDFANKKVLPGAAEANLPSATGREEGRVADGPQGGTPDEDQDGLKEVERALREAAETPTGRKEVGE